MYYSRILVLRILTLFEQKYKGTIENSEKLTFTLEFFHPTLPPVYRGFPPPLHRIYGAKPFHHDYSLNNIIIKNRFPIS